MNHSVLQKCVDELSKDNPKLDYVRGMLETLLSMSEPNVVTFTSTTPLPVLGAITTAHAVSDEGSILDAKARASLETIKALSEQHD